MALSDVCWEFLKEIEAAAQKLAKEVHWYSAPDYPIQYGEEIDALRRACKVVSSEPHNIEAHIQLVRLANAVMRYHDSSGTEGDAAREAEMQALIRVMQSDLSAATAAAVPAVVQDAFRSPTPPEGSETRLKSMLTKLGKPAYDMSVKIITDIGSEALKRALGLR